MMISAVIITHNEEKKIAKTLKSLGFCDEIIIVDDYSTDNTREICRQFTNRIYERSLAGDFSAQRNFGMSQAKGDWILFIDADEIVSEKLAGEIVMAIKAENYDSYRFKRQDVFLGKLMKYGDLFNVKLTRLIKKGKGKWVRPVHEVLETEGDTGELHNPLMHYPHENMSDLLDKINNYSSINTEYLRRNHIKFSIFDLIMYPSTKFILNFILKLGFLDGIHGLILNLIMSFHSFLTRAKLYESVKYEKQA